MLNRCLRRQRFFCLIELLDLEGSVATKDQSELQSWYNE